MTHVVGLSMSSSVKVDYEVETPKGGLPRLAVYLSDQATLELPQCADLDGRIDEINVALLPSDDTGLILSLTFPPVTNSLTYHAMLRGPTSHSSGSIGSTTNNGKKTKHVESWVVGGVLLGLLGAVLFVTGLHCVKKAPRSKIIP
ncbi:hypothetical protein Poli38472_010878 [Pythium oligandrum]|uniref:Uncharacterized protein n=1 Tax=Pythium oligandrum TaxID=41045 RepID=A0A8K1FFM3_PYTOL|nr:hypothetical protein Poli38472_010878 [Pythium oligandrum]|eukprot:TMW61815.1 hypothetical protein Poli38472_010878 [Pythium oligandrum]